MNTNPTKTTIFFLLLILILATPAHAAFDFQSTAPIIEGNTIIDHSGFTYSSNTDGIYKIDYGNGQSTYYGFALSGTVNSNNFVKFTSDYSWTNQISQSGNNIDVSAKNNASNWFTNFSFSPHHTKITNTLTNTLPVAITNAKFYYVFTVSENDKILYNGSEYTIPSTPNTHISGNLNNNLPSLKINNKLLFDFEDIITNGFTVTDIYLNSGTNLGLSYSGNVAAIGFTKNNGIFPAGATVIIDPTLSNGEFNGSANWTFNQGDGVATFSVANGTGNVSVTTTGASIQLYQSGFNMEPSPATYRLRFSANSTAGHDMDVKVIKHTSPFTNFGLSETVNLTTTMTEYTYTFESYGFSGNTTDTRLQFYISNYPQNGENYYFQNVTLETISQLPTSPVSLANTSGNFWINHTWGNGSGNITNVYNVSVNGTWSNGSTNIYYNNSGLPAHGWSNISVYAVNNSATISNMNATPVSQNTQLSNNPVTISNISDTYTVSIGSELAIYPTSSDLDSDTPTFGNTTTNGTFYTNNGTFRWTPQAGDSGTYDWQINVTDGYGSSAYKNFSVSVNSTTPGAPTNLTALSGNFWINHTWNTSVNTNSFNVSVNGTWSNGSANTYYNNSGLPAHGWSNITVYGYNNSASSLGANTSLNTQLTNNVPTFSTSLSSAALTIGQSVTITSNITDLDNDTLTNVTVGITFTSLGGNEVNYSMTQDGTNWSYIYTAGTTGTYSISHLYANDSYTNASTATALTFVVSQASGGGGGGGGGGSSVTTYILPQNATSTFSKLNLTITNLTNGARPVSDIAAINDCLTNNLFLSGECSDATIITISEKSNWYVLFGAFIGAFFALWTLTLQNHKKRSFIYDPIIYSIVTIVASLIISLAGINIMFLGNFLANNSLSAYTFFTLMIYGFVATYILDEVTVKKAWQNPKIPI